jgi:hypothetical protein
LIFGGSAFDSAASLARLLALLLDFDRLMQIQQMHARDKMVIKIRKTIAMMIFTESLAPAM